MVTHDHDDARAHRVARLLGFADGSWTVNVSSIGNGQVALCQRYDFTVRDRSRSVVTKSPSEDATSRDTAKAQHLYRRETSFYRELQSRIGTRTPEAIHIAYEENDDFLLILEDMTPVTPVDQFTGLTLDQARVALREIARLHGPTANATDLFEKPWLAGVAQDIGPLYEAFLPALFAQFLERYRDDIDDDTQHTVATLGRKLHRFVNFEPVVRCVIHGDYRSENLLFDGQGGTVPLAVVDWQTISVGSPFLDVAYFVTTSLTTADRKRFEGELLDHYLGELRELGVDVDRRDAEHEFARYTLQPILMLVAASMIVERTQRGDAMFLTMIKRGVDAVADWNALSWLA